MTNKLNILVVEDDPQLVRILQAVLKETAADLRIAGTGRLALQMVQDEAPAIVLLDLRLPDMSGTEVLQEIRRRGVPATVIVMTAHGSVELAVDAMREGAYDFLTKPLDFERVRVMVRNAIERHRMIEELDGARTQYEQTKYRGLRGTSPVMQRLFRHIRSLAAGSSPVLVLGPKGTEAARAAQALHEESPRAERPLVCREADGLLPADLEAAVLEAGSGTLIVENMQFLPEETAQALANLADDPQTRVRIIATASDQLEQLLRSGRFDERLHSVLSPMTVRLPHLRHRGEDILELAGHFLTEAAQETNRPCTAFSDEAQVALMSYIWPENVRELETTVRGAVEKADGRMVTLEMLPPHVSAAMPSRASRNGNSVRGLENAGTVRPLHELEREAILKALRLCEDDVLQAARLLEVTPGYIYRRRQIWSRAGS